MGGAFRLSAPSQTESHRNSQNLSVFSGATISARFARENFSPAHVPAHPFSKALVALERALPSRDGRGAEVLAKKPSNGLKNSGMFEQNHEFRAIRTFPKEWGIFGGEAGGGKIFR